MPERWSVDWPDFVGLVRAFRSQSLEQGFLVHQLHEWGCPIGLGTLYAAMADALIALSLGGNAPEQISFRPFNRNPEEAHSLGKLVGPDIDVSALVTNARLQTWTMRPSFRA